MGPWSSARMVRCTVVRAPIPRKPQLCAGTGTNRSIALSIMHAAGLVQLDTTASRRIDADQVNPSDDVHSDAALGGTEGYVFNKRTDALATGTWTRSLTVAGVAHQTSFVLFAVRSLPTAPADGELPGAAPWSTGRLRRERGRAGGVVLPEHTRFQ